MCWSRIRRRASSRSPARAMSALRINELAAKPQKGQIWIKRVVAEMGGKDAISSTASADLDDAVNGRRWFGVRVPGAEVFGLLARDCG